MKLAQITDCHLFAEAETLGYADINPYLSLQSTLDVVSAHKPDFLLITGDLSGDASEQSYLHFKTLLEQANLNCGYAIVPGNHDCLTALKNQFDESQLWTSSPHVYGEWVIHYVNTHYQQALGLIDTSDLADLVEDIKQYPDYSHLIATHHHPIPTESWMDKHEWLNREQFTKAIEALPQVVGVVYGHIHMDVVHQRGQVSYLGCPSTCWQWAATPEFSASQQAAGFRIIELAAKGKIRTQVYRIE